MIFSRKMFGVIIGIIFRTWMPVNFKLSLCYSVLQPVKTHVNGFWAFLFQYFVGETHSSSVIHLDRRWGLGVIQKMSAFIIGMASFAFSKADAISVSAADAMTFFMIVQRTWIAPFRGTFWGLSSFLERKKYPPTRLRLLETDKYDPSLCTCRIMLLLWYRSLAMGWVAA